MKVRFENVEQRLRGMDGSLRLRAVKGVEKNVSTDWQQADPRGDVLRLRRARVG